MQTWSKWWQKRTTGAEQSLAPAATNYNYLPSTSYTQQHTPSRQYSPPYSQPYTQQYTPPVTKPDPADGCLRLHCQTRHNISNRVIIGNWNTLSGSGLIVYGDHNTVSDSLHAVSGYIGKRNEVYGNSNVVSGHCLVSGDRNRVTGTNCIVKGSNNIVNGEHHASSDSLSSPSSEIGFFHADEAAAIDTVNQVDSPARQRPVRRSRRLAKRGRSRRRQARTRFIYNEVDASSSSSGDDEYDIFAQTIYADEDEDDPTSDPAVEIYSDLQDYAASDTDPDFDIDASHDYYI